MEPRALLMELLWRGAVGAVAVFMVSRLLFSPGDSLSARLVLLTMLALEGERVRTVLTEATETLACSSTEDWETCLTPLPTRTTTGLSFLGFLKLCLRTVRTLLRPTLAAGSSALLTVFWGWVGLLLLVLLL